jgi:GT2 family glycosyltransferase
MKQRYVGNIIVVDDCTPEAEREALVELVRVRHKLPLFRNSVNLGFPKTVHKGVVRVTSRAFMILNTDVILLENAVEILATEISNSDVGVVDPMLIFPDDCRWSTPGKIQHVGMATNVQAMPVHIFLGWSVDNPRAVQRRDNLPYVTGACMVTSKDLWKTIGGFSFDYGRGTFEDCEYCISVRHVMGKKVVCNPDARGLHYTGQTAISMNVQYPVQQNARIFQMKMGKHLRHDEYLFW